MDGCREGPDSSFSINRIEYYAVIVEVLWICNIRRIWLEFPL